MKINIPVRKEDSLDICEINVEKHFIIIYNNQKPIGTILYEPDGGTYFSVYNVLYEERYIDTFDSLLECIEDVLMQFPHATFEAYE